MPICKYIIDLSKTKSTRAVTSVFNSLPKHLSNNPAIVAEYIRFLFKNQEYAIAEDLLSHCLQKRIQFSTY